MDRKSRPHHEHSPHAIRERLSGKPRHSYLRDWVYGGIDGSVTTFAVVSGVAGAALSPRIVIILGMANLIADGFSMAASNYLGTSSERSEMEQLRRMEEEHIRLFPEGEKEEVRQIYRAKGFDGAVLEQIVDTITSERERWIATMLSEEFNLPGSVRSPVLAGLTTFTAFGICGLVPLLAYLFGAQAPLFHASWLTGATFFGIGSLKSLWIREPWWRSGLETLLIGGAAAALAYGAGSWLGAV